MSNAQSIKQRKTDLGYCHSGNRPTCANCSHLLTLGLSHKCAVGNFTPVYSGWSTTAGWTFALPHVAKLFQAKKNPANPCGV